MGLERVYKKFVKMKIRNLPICLENGTFILTQVFNAKIERKSLEKENKKWSR